MRRWCTGTGTCWPISISSGDNPAEALAKSKYLHHPAVLAPRGRSTPFWSRSAPWRIRMEMAVMVLSTDQGAYDTQHEIMGMLGLPAEQVKVRNCLVGGGFGGKEDVTVQHHAALIAYLHEAAGEGEAHAGGKPADPPQAASHGDGILSGLRRKRDYSGRGGGVYRGHRRLTPLWAGRCWNGPAPTAPGRISMRHMRSTAGPTIPTIPQPEPSGASA